eukprot:scaffold7524_cov334-Pinguiococcus_pyrenoidosus.AAC.1
MMPTAPMHPYGSFAPPTPAPARPGSYHRQPGSHPPPQLHAYFPDAQVVPDAWAAAQSAGMAPSAYGSFPAPAPMPSTTTTAFAPLQAPGYSQRPPEAGGQPYGWQGVSMPPCKAARTGKGYPYAR